AKVLELHEEGKFRLKKELEDVHMNVEAKVTEITPLGKKMHTARSRNDQVAVDTKLYLRDELLEVAALIVKVQKAFAQLAKKDVPMPAYTHTRVAQPVMTSFWCEAYVQAFSRDLERVFDAYKKTNRCPLGACAVSGTRWSIDRKRTAELLGFESVMENEMDAVGSRGELEAEIAFALSQVMARISRFAEEGIWFSEMGMIKIGDEYATGSSIMPNKKNADILELMRGRCGRVYGSLVHILTVQKGLINGYNSDTQESKFAVMSALDTAKQSLAILADLAPTLEFDEKKMAYEIKRGYANATEIADLLAMGGMPFREAHEKSGKLVAELIKQGKFIEDAEPAEINKIMGTNLEESAISEVVELKKARLCRKVTVSGAWEKEIEKQKGKIGKAIAGLLE
ncbi:MAG: argininosuccinate lyase, partial [Candidatus Micrarchaeia archaeon]